MNKIRICVFVILFVNFSIFAEIIIPLTKSKGNDKFAIYSPDGEKIVFIRQENSKEGIWLLDIKEKKEYLLTGQLNSPKDICFSSDSRRIVFSSEGKIYLLDVSFLSDVKKKYLVNGERPVFSPDGEKIGFIKNRKICVLDNGEEKELTGEYSNLDIAWVNGEEIIFCGDGNIYILNIKDKKVTLISELREKLGNNLYYTKIYVSPNKKEVIAVVPMGLVAPGEDLTRAVGDVLYLVKKDSFEEISYGRNPCWSSDSKKIVFEDEEEIYIYSITEKRKIKLTDDNYLDERPVFSPDGKSIIFSSVRRDTNNDGIINWKDSSDIYKMVIE